MNWTQASSFQTWVTNNEDKVGEIIFNIIILIFMAFFFFEVRQLRPTSALFPNLLLGLLFISWIATTISLVSSKYNIGKKQPSESTSGESDELYEIELSNTVVNLLWIAIFLISMIYIGFFTTIFFFAFIYLYLYHEKAKHKILSPLAWSVGIVGLQYIFFLELLFRPFVLRFGFLP
ncbi:hypothetical protein OB919_11825 [Halobacteria archaeon AArc-curdl1]|uniref:Tripartite tricarboxylate transporter TctB family protein n=1 Tax=Natronosalvus hydrolyticus TaxID=2979988 RepID=A0AAP2Z8H7_9EURY|nr:hypothetical protein [Halobacteria archaeon AArc-curdl1]